MNYAYQNENVGYAQSATITTAVAGERATVLTGLAARLEALTKALADLEIDVGRNAVRTFGHMPEAVDPINEANLKPGGSSLGRIESAIRDLERTAQKLGVQCRRFDEL